MLNKIKAPYAVIAVLMLTMTGIFLMAIGSVDGVGFKVSAVLMGGFITRGALAVSLGALNSSLVMLTCALSLFVGMVLLLDTQLFQDSAAEALGVSTVTGALVLVMDYLKRHEAE